MDEDNPPQVLPNGYVYSTKVSSCLSTLVIYHVKMHQVKVKGYVPRFELFPAFRKFLHGLLIIVTYVPFCLC